MTAASPSRTANLVAVAVIVGIIAALAVIVVAGQRAASLHGPLALAVSGDRVYFQAGRHLYAVDGGGKLVSRHSLEELGIEGSTVDIEAVGEALWLLQDDGQIKRCRMGAGVCEPLFAILKRGLHADASQIKVDEAGKRVYVSVAAEHRVDVYKLSGEHLDRLDPEKPLLFPNGLALTDAGDLVVADTNNHRIAALTVAEKGVDTAWEFSAKTILARPRHLWPAAVERDGRGRWWVINMDDGMVDGDLLVFSADGKPQQRVELPAGADPIDLAPLGESMVVADFEGFGLFKVGQAEGRFEPFGDRALQRYLSESRRIRDGWRATRSITVASTLLMALLAGIALYLDRRALQVQRRELRQTDPQALSAPAGTQMDEEGMTWIGVNPRTRRLLKFVLYLAVGAWVLQALVAAPFFADPRVILMWLPMLPLIGVLFIIVRRITHARIGLGGSRIEVIDARGRSARGRLDEVVYTTRSLLLHGVAVNFRLFAREALEEVLLPRLHPATRVGHLRMLWLQARLNAVPLLFLLALVLMITASVWNASSLKLPDLPPPGDEEERSGQPLGE